MAFLLLEDGSLLLLEDGTGALLLELSAGLDPWRVFAAQTRTFVVDAAAREWVIPARTRPFVMTV